MTATIAIVYHSASGRTRALAAAVERGAQTAGATVHVMEAASASHATLAAADAIVLGCPTYMGSASAQFKAFMDGTAAVWALEGWRDKLATGFTHSAAPSGDKLGTLVQLATFAAQHGMVWVGLGLPPTYASGRAGDGTNRLGSHLGLMAQSPPGGALPEEDLRTAELLGARIATAAQRWGRTPARVSVRHRAAHAWAFPPAREDHELERVNLKELVARAERFEHHLVPCATIGAAQLEITAASEPLYFGHVNISDEYALALPTGDDLVDRFPLRTFLADAASGDDVARYNHRNGDLVLHPVGTLHWPGKLRPPYELPFDVPPGMRRSGLSLVYCAAVPTPPANLGVPIAADRAADAKAYVAAPPPLLVTALRDPGVVAAIGDTTLELVVRPAAIAPPRGGWVVILDADGAVDAGHAACDLLRLPPGARLDGAGISRALVFASPTAAPDPVPPVWQATPPPPLAPYEDLPPGALPVAHGAYAVREKSPKLVEVAVGDAAVEVPRYWLARTLYRLALHGLRLGYIETYGGAFFDDRAGTSPDVTLGIRRGRDRTAIDLPRADALALIERIYRAVAPPGYVERLR
ncbi:MAG: flavodoxin family protein [Deltaproteobacteria bacterium]|nr:flavodoxin family protein [Deltaproteobacteria bacterium]